MLRTNVRQTSSGSIGARPTDAEKTQSIYNTWFAREKQQRTTSATYFSSRNDTVCAYTQTGYTTTQAIVCFPPTINPIIYPRFEHVHATLCTTTRISCMLPSANFGFSEKSLAPLCYVFVCIPPATASESHDRNINRSGQDSKVV